MKVSCILSFWSLLAESLKLKLHFPVLEMDTTFAVIAIVSTLALFGVVAVTVATLTIQLQQADAAI